MLEKLKKLVEKHKEEIVLGATYAFFTVSLAVLVLLMLKIGIFILAMLMVYIVYAIFVAVINGIDSEEE